MAETKYRKYIITGAEADLKLPAYRRDVAEIAAGAHTRSIYLDDKVIKGACHVECIWYWRGGSEQSIVEAHTHHFDEVIAFFGTSREDPQDLCGEIELWLEDEKHILTKSFLAFIPKGMKHCPLIVKRVDRPIFHFLVVLGGEYE
jgi:hypothetical protein